MTGKNGKSKSSSEGASPHADAEMPPDRTPAPGDVPSPILLHEEVLEPVIEETVHGRAIVRKWTETVDRLLTVDAHRQHVSVERRPVDIEIESAPAPYWDGNTLVVPVMEEEIVIEKRLILREELLVTLEWETIPQVLPTSVRREKVEVIEEPDPNGRS